VSIAKKAITGTFWLGGVSYVTFGISLAGNITLARLLMPQDFGIFALALALSELLYILTNFSFSEGVIQIQDEENVADMAFVLSLALGGFLVILTLILSPILAHFYSKRLAIIFLVLCGAGLINLLADVYAAQLRKEFEFKNLSIIQLFASSLSVLLAIGMAFYGFGVWSLLTRSLLRTVLSFFGYRWISSWKFSCNINRKAFRRIFEFGSKMFLLRGLEIVYCRLDRLIIGILSNATVLGFYHQARYLADLGNVTISPVSVQVAFPTYARFQTDTNRISEAYRIINYFIVRIMMFFLLTFAIFPTEFVTLLYGEKWIPAASALQIFAFYTFFMPIYGNIKTLLIGVGRISEAAKTRLFQVISLIPLLTLGLLWRGLEGAAAATVLAMVAGIIGCFYYLRRFCPLSLKDIYGKPIIAGVLTALIFFSIRLNFSESLKTLEIAYSILALNLTYALLLLALENKKLLRNIRFIYDKLRAKKWDVSPLEGFAVTK
jgi:O-antigen/teichoic acid export membrane protein